MNLRDTLGLTAGQALQMGIAALGVAFLIGARLYWRGRNVRRVRIDLSDRP